MSVAFVGRRHELATITGVAQRARSAVAPTGALVVGDPGSGKTRLLQEVARRLSPWTVIHLVGFEPMRLVPFGAAGPLLRHLITAPEHGSNLESLVFGRPDTGTMSQVRILEAAQRAAAALPAFVVAADDLQWFDERSLALIHYLMSAAVAGSRSLTLLAFSRPSSAAAATRSSLEAALPDEHRALVSLGPLSLEDSTSFVRSIDVDIGVADAAEIWRRAQGSPFWLESLARRRLGIPTEDLIGERLRSIGGASAELLAMLAVGSRPFAAADLAHALGWSADHVRHAARELVAGGLAVDAHGVLALTHDLIREATLQGLPAANAKRLHAALAGALEETAGTDVQVLREALEHRQQSGLPAASLAYRLITSPQRRLLDASTLRAIASVADSSDAGLAERATLDSALAAVAAEVGEDDIALARWSLVALRCPEGSKRVEAELEAARAAYGLRRAQEAYAHLDAARAVPETPSAALVSIDALEADVAFWLENDRPRFGRAAERALDGARRLAAGVGGPENLPAADATAYLAALEAANDWAMQSDDAETVIGLSREVMALAQGVDEVAYLQGMIRAAFALSVFGLTDEAEAMYRRAWCRSKELVLPSVTLEAGRHLGRVLKTLGRLREARDVALETRALEARVSRAPKPWGGAVLQELELSLGDTANALRGLRRTADLEKDPHPRLSIHETIAQWQARFAGRNAAQDVESEIDKARADAVTSRCPRCSAQVSVVAVEVLARAGNVEAARQALKSYDAAGAPTYALHQAWRLTAECAIAVAEKDDRAESLLQQLSTMLESLGRRRDLFWTRLDLGRTLAGADRRRAIEVLTDAANLADQMGAATEGRLAARELRALGVRAWRRGHAAAGHGIEALSEREREIARLVAGGRSNREIADALVVSPKTVERHVTNALAKLTLRNRTELASLVHASGTGITR